ncbi:asparaginase [Micromonospora polyrhachis]|uniref:asparaginase n=1 Tax=Micromonospora polyrhachis TaxID=1282883 RepID=A0A7W7WR76_9ACTN|nr:asparaginase [Micromonospora polyrhachis]MBB4960242.1 L-asparaginase [Micromonospora polyrhachis]
MTKSRSRSTGMLALVVLGFLAATAVPGSANVPTKTSKRESRPKVAVIGTGGTIAGKSESRVGFQSYQPGRTPVAELVDFLQPEVGQVADVSSVDFGEKGSSEYTIAEFHDLSRLVDEQLTKADAVVVATGTQTMEELAYWLDLTVRSPKPVVVTGSMRPWTVIGSDGPPNLYNAITLAAGRRTRCFGTVIMMNDEILAARDATKTSTTRLDTLQSPELGILGTMDEKNVRLHRAPARVHDCAQPKQWRTPFDLATMPRDGLAKVEIVYSYADAGGESITAMAAAGVKGVVAAGTPSPAQTAALMSSTQSGMAVVAANRNNTGAVYDTPGPVIPAEDLLPQKSRLLLLLALSRTGDPAEVRSLFQRYAVPEFGPIR